MKAARIRDLMTPAPQMVSMQATLGQCAKLMVKHDIRHVLVDLGETVGLVSDFVVFGALRTTGNGASAVDYAHTLDLVAAPGDPLGDIIKKLAKNRGEVAVVKDGDQVVGVIAEHDVVHLARELLPIDLMAADIASKPVHSVDVRATAIDAMNVMFKEGIRHVVVLMNQQPRGVVSYRDLVGLGGEIEEALVRDLVNVDELQFVEARASARATARKMTSYRIGCMPVLDDQAHVTSVVTRTDILRAMAQVLGEDTPMALEHGRFSVRRTLSGTFDDALARVRSRLVDEGLTITFELNLRKRAQLETPYALLSVIDPQMARQAVVRRGEFGLLCQWQVAVFTEGPNQVVAAVEPHQVAEGDVVAQMVLDGLEERLHRAIRTVPAL